jgi:large conductance mechanosensitive channel
MLKGFRDFVLRGNVIDLAVAVVIGAAFTAVVAVIGDSLINPVVAALGGPDTTGLGFFIQEGNDATFVNVGAIITVAINFLITAAVVYFIFVGPMNALNERRRAKLGTDQIEDVPADVALLTEIRDLLAEQGSPEARSREV